VPASVGSAEPDIAERRYCLRSTTVTERKRLEQARQERIHTRTRLMWALEKQNLNFRLFTTYAESLAKILVQGACRIAEMRFALAATTTPGQHAPASDEQRNLVDENEQLHQEMEQRGEVDRFFVRLWGAFVTRLRLCVTRCSTSPLLRMP
jgi:hypothetical protein